MDTCLKAELPSDPAITLLRVCPKDSTSYHRDICFSTFIAAPFTTAKKWIQPGCPSTEEQIMEVWYMHAQNFIQP